MMLQFLTNKTINCFFYNRAHIFSAGLAAVTSDRTFHHIHKYINYYPNISIKYAIITTQEGVLKMKNDWSVDNFLLKFEQILFS